MKYTVERIEDNIAVIEDENGKVRFMIKNVADEVIAKSLQDILDSYI